MRAVGLERRDARVQSHLAAARFDRAAQPFGEPADSAAQVAEDLAPAGLVGVELPPDPVGGNLVGVFAEAHVEERAPPVLEHAASEHARQPLDRGNVVEVERVALELRRVRQAQARAQRVEAGEAVVAQQVARARGRVEDALHRDRGTGLAPDDAAETAELGEQPTQCGVAVAQGVRRAIDAQSLVLDRLTELAEPLRRLEDHRGVALLRGSARRPTPRCHHPESRSSSPTPARALRDRRAALPIRLPACRSTFARRAPSIANAMPVVI
jgi:hypothetical protein